MNTNRKKIQMPDLTPMDDLFFQKFMEEKDVVEEMLQTFLDRKDLKVKSVFPQKSLANLQGRSVRLDSLSEVLMNTKKVYVNIESQKTDNDDHFRRIRFHNSLITSNFALPNTKFAMIPDVICIYMTLFDPFRKNRSLYFIDRIVRGTNIIAENGIQEIYVNAAADDGTPVSRLMKVMSTTDGYSEEFPTVSAKKKQFKDSEKGENGMKPWYQDIMDEEFQQGYEKAKAEAAEEIRSANEEAKFANLKAEKALDENKRLRQIIEQIQTSSSLQQ
jgi:hypothetical protein